MAITEENSESSQQSKAENVKITIEEQVQSMKKKFSQYHVQDQKSIVGCNYSVPSNLRKENEDAYTPRVVSIGPIHHGKPQLQALEQSKWMLLGRYFNRPSALSFNEMIRVAINIEEQARMSYLERFDNINSQEFLEMIILDFIFLIEIFFQIDTDDLAFQDSTFLDIISDMMLLENQLPQRVVTSLFDMLYKKDGNLGNLILKYINIYCCIVGSPKAHPNDWKSATDMLDFIMMFYDDKIKSTLNSKNEIMWLGRSPSAIELREGGVEFSKEENAEFLLDVKFDNGVLKMPLLKIDEFTEVLFQNMIACEQTRRDKPKRISGYINLLSCLVRSPKDLNLLSNCGIIQHPDDDIEDVISLFGTLATGVTYDPKKCYFWGVYVDMHEYSKKHRHKWKGSWYKWKRMLRENYFSSPWSIISFIAAFMLLVLTIIQTAYAIMQK